ncbi:MAG: dienelactone hydrolase family protein [Pirellulaceae bacterium]|nr:dienelactone hydrolase family protein [Pirellulaceae bacterium]
MSRSGSLSRRSFVAASVAASMIPRLARADDQPLPRDVPWLADLQQPPSKIAENAPRLPSLLTGEDGHQIATVAAWQEQRQSLRNRWLEFLGPLARVKPQAPQLSVIERDELGGVIRERVRYFVEDQEEVQAYILRPRQIDGRAPGVVVLHSTVDHSIRQPAGVEGRPALAFGLSLAQQGCVTICPRNYLWPTNDKIAPLQEANRFLKRQPESKGMARMLYDAIAAVEILASFEFVDMDRIGAVGHSLGAKEVLYLAAFDERIKVTVSSEGGISTTFSNWDAPWYLGKSINEENFKLQHHQLLGLIAPRPFLLVGGDSADGDMSWPFIQRAKPVYDLYGTPARIGLFNHKQGHSIPAIAASRINDWLMTYL